MRLHVVSISLAALFMVRHTSLLFVVDYKLVRQERHSAVLLVVNSSQRRNEVVKSAKFVKRFARN